MTCRATAFHTQKIMVCGDAIEKNYYQGQCSRGCQKGINQEILGIANPCGHQAIEKKLLTCLNETV
nr:AAC_HP1_G0006730.mRNA.1.CDS.1 [Saccharomyces cerevisiae]